MLAYCNYQPVLLHIFGQALVKRMCGKGAGVASLPIDVDEADIEAVADSPEFQDRTREKLKLTLDLDSRYRVIVYSIVLEAHERGLGISLSTSELRNAAERWWRAGFANADASEFRSLLEELVGLGVLF